MIFVYGNDLNLYSESLKDYEYKTISDLNNLLDTSIKNDIIIISDMIFSEEKFDLIHSLVINKNKLIVLDPVPSYNIGEKLISLGVKAYANMLINNVHLKDVIKTVIEGNIWLYPEFINNLVLNMSKDNLNTKKDEFELLTKREKEIAHLILEKRTYLNIADQLKISLRTVKTHTKNIYNKLNVESRLSFILEFS